MKSSAFTSSLAHVCIETDDLDKTETFYAVLGLQRRYEFRNQEDVLVGFYLAFPGSATYIEVIWVREPPPAGIIRHFSIEVDDIHAAYAALSEAGVEVTTAVLEKDQTLMITCHDPNGIFMEIQQYTPESMQIRGGVCRVDYIP